MVDQEQVVKVRVEGAERSTRQLRSFGREGAAAVNLLPGPLGRVASGLNGPAGIGVAAGAAALAMTGAVRAAAQYETSLVKLETQLGLTTFQVGAIKAQLNEISTEAGRSAVELAEAAFAIQSAGLRGRPALEATEAAAKGAAIGLGTTRSIGLLAASAMNAFGKEALGAADNIDILAAAVKVGNTDAAELAASLGSAISVAAALGVGFDELAASVAFYTTLGNNAAEATTAVNATMTGLLNPGQQAQDVLKRIGLSVDDLHASIRERGLLATLIDLREAVGDDQQAFAQLVGPTRALRFALAATSEEGAEKATASFKEVADSAGTVDAAFDRVSETVQHKYNVAVQEAAAVTREVGDAAKPLATGILDVAAGGLSALGVALGEVLDRLDIADTAGELGKLAEESEEYGEALEGFGLKWTDLIGIYGEAAIVIRGVNALTFDEQQGRIESRKRVAEFIDILQDEEEILSRIAHLKTEGEDADYTAARAQEIATQKVIDYVQERTGQTIADSEAEAVARALLEVINEVGDASHDAADGISASADASADAAVKMEDLYIQLSPIAGLYFDAAIAAEAYASAQAGIGGAEGLALVDQRNYGQQARAAQEAAAQRAAARAAAAAAQEARRQLQLQIHDLRNEQRLFNEGLEREAAGYRELERIGTNAYDNISAAAKRGLYELRAAFEDRRDIAEEEQDRQLAELRSDLTRSRQEQELAEFALRQRFAADARAMDRQEREATRFQERAQMDRDDAQRHLRQYIGGGLSDVQRRRREGNEEFNQQLSDLRRQLLLLRAGGGGEMKKEPQDVRVVNEPTVKTAADAYWASLTEGERRTPFVYTDSQRVAQDVLSAPITGVPQLDAAEFNAIVFSFGEVIADFKLKVANLPEPTREPDQTGERDLAEWQTMVMDGFAGTLYTGTNYNTNTVNSYNTINNYSSSTTNNYSSTGGPGTGTRTEARTGQDYTYPGGPDTSEGGPTGGSYTRAQRGHSTTFPTGTSPGTNPETDSIATPDGDSSGSITIPSLRDLGLEAGAFN